MTDKRLRILYILMAAGAFILAAIPFCAKAETFHSPLEETRYCGPPVRDSHGVIVRSSAVKAAFRRAHPCPSTGLTYGACPNYSIQHPIPLACGGCDAVRNMEWMRNDIKAIHDSYERKIYGAGIPDTANCSKPPIGGIK